MKAINLSSRHANLDALCRQIFNACDMKSHQLCLTSNEVTRLVVPSTVAYRCMRS